MDTAAAATDATLAASDFHSGATPIWCPGCGDYGVLSALEHALAAHGRPPHEVVLVSGIGCSSRLPAYTKCYGFHGVHGRALPFAAGVKMARPDLEVIAVGGDGDGHLLLDTGVTFLLTSGGHNASIVSETGRSGRRYRVEGDKHLFNQSGIILVNPAKHAHVKKDFGQAFIDWGDLGGGAERHQALQDPGPAAVLP